jgi:hypothetical protein
MNNLAIEKPKPFIEDIPPLPRLTVQSLPGLDFFFYWTASKKFLALYAQQSWSKFSFLAYRFQHLKKEA